MNENVERIRKSVNWGGRVKRLNVLVVMALMLSLLMPLAAPFAQQAARIQPLLLQLAAQQPDQLVSVIVQKTVKDDRVEQAVGALDGTVTKDLHIINAFAAEMTAKDVLQLAKVNGVRWVSLDAPTIASTTLPDFVVNSTGDGADANTVDGICQTATPGQCTLRAAIQQANARAGANTIGFSISGTVTHTIAPTSALPNITEPVAIDATTDDSFLANGSRPAIILAGTNAGIWVTGLVLGSGADGSVMRGLVIRDWGGDGIEIQPGSDNNVIAGNYIGKLTPTGTDSGPFTGNGYQGIWIQGSGNRIGGTNPADVNVISGNEEYGILIEGASATGNVVLGNYIGTDATGTLDIGNTYAGVVIGDAANNTIGGRDPGARNLISGNDEAGVELWGATSTGNQIVGNWIGLNSAGVVSLGNRWAGVWLNAGAAGNVIGGTASGAGNVIAGQTAGDGVELRNDAGLNNAVLGNSIYSNHESGIDLVDDGVSLNNGARSPSLPNYGMDYPVITSASLSGCWLTVAGYVGSAPNQSAFANARVEFFKSAADTNGYSEGQTFLGYLTSDAGGNFSGHLSGSGFNTGDRLTATATDSGNNTSEFGPNFQVTAANGNCGTNPVFTTWATVTGTVTAMGFTSGAAIFDSALGPNATYGYGGNVKGAFGGFVAEVTPGNSIAKVEVVLRGYVAAKLGNDPKITAYAGGVAGSPVVLDRRVFDSYVGAAAVGTVYLDITGSRTWRWSDFENDVQLLIDQSQVDATQMVYYDAIGLQVASTPGSDLASDSGGDTSAVTAVNTSTLLNVYNQVIRSSELWNTASKLQGKGVTVAVVDSGVLKTKDLSKRVRANANFNTKYHGAADRYGHGTFVAGVVAGSGSQSGNKYMGVAPRADVLNVRVSDDQGMSTESDVVSALQWVLDNKGKYNIRVVNLSLNSSVAQSYHTSPLGAACEILWFNGIVVVVAAGNNGTATLFPPANDPFVVTVGATDDKGTLSTTDDVVTTFSAYGTTESGFAKPDLVAPGTKIIGLLPDNDRLSMSATRSANRIDKNYFKMSGTSVSAPMVSGAVALLLQDEPNLTPDQVKYRLKATANKTWPGYSATTAGAGYLD